MKNVDLIKLLGSKTRREILKILAKEEKHLSGLAREIGISIPVAYRHCKILEKCGLITSKKFGRTIIFRLSKVNVEEILNSLDICSIQEIEINRKTSIIEILKKTCGVEVKKFGEKEYLVSVDGEKGFYIYEVNGELPSLPINEFEIEQDSRIILKKLVPIKKKEIIVRFGKKYKKLF